MAFLFQALIIFFGLFVPIALLIWLWRTCARSRIQFATLVLLVGAALIDLKWSLPWPGVFWPRAYFVAFGVILLVRIIRGRIPAVWLPAGRREWISAGLNMVFAAFWSLGVLGVFQARTLPAAPVPLELSTPFRQGFYYVVSGGGNFSTNQHFFSPVSRYAIDIAKQDDWRSWTSGLFRRDLHSYAIYGDDIVSPCSGEVIGIENALPDQNPGHPDSSKQGTGGNHVVLFCRGHSVLVGHLRQGSVAVALGDHVKAGRLLGQVGNSGNSIAPHLHIGAVRGRYAYDHPDREAPPDIEAAPLLIQGRFLVRGDTLVASEDLPPPKKNSPEFQGSFLNGGSRTGRVIDRFCGGL